MLKRSGQDPESKKEGMKRSEERWNGEEIYEGEGQLLACAALERKEEEGGMARMGRGGWEGGG